MRSSAIFLVSVVTNTRSLRSARRADLFHQVVDLVARRPHLDFGIDEARRPNDHLDDLRSCA